jgi:hypothetical protein
MKAVPDTDLLAERTTPKLRKTSAAHHPIAMNCLANPRIFVLSDYIRLRQSASKQKWIFNE